MNAFTVTVHRLGKLPYTFPAVGTDSGAVHLATLDRFGVCGVFVRPA